MKRITSLLLGLAFSGVLLAQEYATATLSVADTLYSVLATKAKIVRLTLTATTGSATTFKLYDSTNTVSSNIVVGSYYYPTSYATNYSTTWTNITGPDGSGLYVTNIFTNSFTGTYTAWTATGASTNERPRTVQITVPGSTTRTIDVTRYLKLGLTAQADAAGVVEAEYYP